MRRVQTLRAQYHRRETDWHRKMQEKTGDVATETKYACLQEAL